MSCRVWVVPVGLMLLGCGAAAEPTPSTAASSAPETAVRTRPPAAPADVVRSLPVLSGSLPKLPAGALRIAVRRETVDAGETEVARLKEGALVGGESGALVRRLSEMKWENADAEKYGLSPSRALLRQRAIDRLWIEAKRGGAKA